MNLLPNERRDSYVCGEYTYTPITTNNSIVGVFKRKKISVDELQKYINSDNVNLKKEKPIFKKHKSDSFLCGVIANPEFSPVKVSIDGFDCSATTSKRENYVNESTKQIKIKDFTNNSSVLVNYSDIASYVMSNRDKNKPYVYGSICLKNIYDRENSILKRQVDIFEQWQEEEDFDAMGKYIMKRTIATKYSGCEYSCLLGENELQAKSSIEIGEILGHYGGKLIAESECKHLSREYNREYFISDYVFNIPGDSNLVLDGTKGTQMHYINDGTIKTDAGKCDSNRYNSEFFVVYKTSKIDGQDVLVPRVYVVAIKDIKCGETIWMNYGKKFWQIVL